MDFPFDNIVGLIVFVIIVVAQIWTKYRAMKKGQPVPRDEDEMDPWEPVSREPAPPPGRRKTPEEELREFMEALGVPTQSAPPPLPKPEPPPPPRPVPVPKAAPRPAAPVVRRAAVPPPPPPRPVEAFPEPEGGMEDMDPGELVRRPTEDHLFTTRAERATGSSVSGDRADAFMQTAWMKEMSEADVPTTSVNPADGRADELVRTLKDRSRLQTALVLNEVLGAPRALRAF